MISEHALESDGMRTRPQRWHLQAGLLQRFEYGLFLPLHIELEQPDGVDTLLPRQASDCTGLHSVVTHQLQQVSLLELLESKGMGLQDHVAALEPCWQVIALDVVRVNVIHI